MIIMTIKYKKLITFVCVDVCEDRETPHLFLVHFTKRIEESHPIEKIKLYIQSIHTNFHHLTWYNKIKFETFFHLSLYSFISFLPFNIFLSKFSKFHNFSSNNLI